MEQSKSVFSMEKIFILRKWKKIYPVFFFSGEKIGKKERSKRSESFRTQHFKTKRGEIYKGVDMEKDISRLLTLVSQNKVPTSFVNISYMW